MCHFFCTKKLFYFPKGLEITIDGEEEAEKGAATEVARPGTSEHNLGLAVDFNSVEQSFESTEAFRWLKKNCTKYGFILRYSEAKLDVTGVIYEPWHYRYVGEELAKILYNNGDWITMEAYYGLKSEYRGYR